MIMKKLVALSLLSSSTLTPLFALTSCGTNYVEPVTMYNMLDEATWPQVDPIHVSGVKTQPEMSDLYIQSVVADKSIFAKDMVYAAKDYIDIFKEMFIEDEISLTQFELGFSTPTFGTTSITHVGEVDETVNTISCKQKVHITYEMGQPSDTIHYIEDINVEIVYHNVIFVAYESIEKEPWCVGLLDNDTGNESFWYYQFDSGPWSISYSCTNEKSKIIKGGEGRPDVVINDTEYYSGVFDDVYKLKNAYTYTQKESESVYDKINQTFLRMVLLLDYRSKLLSKVDRDVDIRCWSPLFANANAQDQIIPIEIEGFAFFPPTKYDINQATVTLVSNEPIELVEDAQFGGRGTIALSNQPIVINDLNKPFTQIYKTNAIYNPGSSDPSEYKTFIIPVESLTFKIEYSAEDSQGNILTEEKNIILNLHYSTLTLNFIV